MYVLIVNKADCNCWRHDNPWSRRDVDQTVQTPMCYKHPDLWWHGQAQKKEWERPGEWREEGKPGATLGPMFQLSGWSSCYWFTEPGEELSFTAFWWERRQGSGMDTHRKPGLLVDGAPNRRVTRNILLTEEALLSGLWVSKKDTTLRGGNCRPVLQTE